MEKQPNMDEIEIDFQKLLKALWSRVWIILLSGVVCAGILFGAAYLLIQPEYSSSAQFYVNNSSSSSQTVTSSELSAAKSLLNIYVVILKSPETINRVIEKANLAYNAGEVSKMISAASVDGTEIFSVSVSAPNPIEAKLILDTIGEILPDRIGEIVEGSSVRIVSPANLPTSSYYPSYPKFTVLGGILGIVLSCAVIIVLELANNTVRDEDYLINTYGYPILAAVPDLLAKEKGGYYGKSRTQHSTKGDME